MLDADEGSEVPHASTNVRLSPQYFDGEKRIGDGLAWAFGVRRTMWDIFLFYPPGATSTADGLPVPEVAIAQDNAVVLGTPGSLPALSDQSQLPADRQGVAVVIGAQDHFEQILRQVAVPFAARHRH
jgi:hypothetical protein